MFGLMVISNAGAALVRKAASGSKKLVFTRAKSGSQWDDSRADLANKPADWYDGIDGTISGVTAGSDGLKVVASFTAADSGDLPVKSVCICAQLKKDGVDPEYDEADDVIFAATCNDNSCFTIADSFSVNFDLPIPMSSVVDNSGSTSGDYVTLDTKQNIIAEKSFGIGSDGWNSTLEIVADGVVITDGDSADPKPNSIAIDSFNLSYRVEGDAYYTSFSFDTMPLQITYKPADNTVDLKCGDGTVVRLTCTSVEVNPE